MPPLAKHQIAAIYEAAKAQGLITTAAIAKRTGVNRSYLSDILNGHTGPGMDVATKLSGGLRLPIEFLTPVARNESETEGTNYLDVNGRVAAQSPGHTLDYVERVDGEGARWRPKPREWGPGRLPKLPVFEWGTCGQPGVSGEGAAVPVEWREYPEGDAVVRKIGPNGYAVRIKGESMANWGFEAGDLVWVNPDLGHGAGINEPVLAQLLDETGGDLGMVVKVLRQRDGLFHLQSDGDGVDELVPPGRFLVLGVCVRHTPHEREPRRKSPADRTPPPSEGIRYLGDGDDTGIISRRAG